MRIAEACPHAQVVLIGQADTDTSGLDSCSNILLMGPRSFDHLPEYMSHFSVGIIPFKQNDLTRSVNPIKLREMLAAGCPVVSTDLPEVRGKDGVTLCHSHEAFVKAVLSHIDLPLTLAKRASLSAGVADESWAARVETLLEIIRSHEQDRGDSS